MATRSTSPIPTGIGRDGWLVLAVTMAAIAMLLSILAVGLGVRAIEQGNGAGSTVKPAVCEPAEWPHASKTATAKP
jgi:hypothetical protein